MNRSSIAIPRRPSLIEGVFTAILQRAEPRRG